MRAVVQRVEKAKVIVEDRLIAEIGHGLLVFIGIAQGDRDSDADYLSDRIMNLRIFDDEQGKMNLSLLDIRGELLVVSQFTLLGDCHKGRRPSFTSAEKPDLARQLCNYFIETSKEKIQSVKQGQFQAMMSVELVNDGPVTMILDSRQVK
jgi:D-tyrosyl-tRNA(Tyr) deacylase